jgi:Fe-S-cluster-containing hydrogenase component 2/flavodoxin
LKGIVVYYSATGSTRKVAKAIHRGMKDLMEECDIAPINQVDPQDMAKYDLIGIGGPIWYYRETANLRLFVYNMPNLEGKLCFPFCSHGSSPSGFMFSLGWALRRKGLEIIGYGDWYGSVFQVLHMPKPYFTDGHPDEIDLKEAEDFGREMAGLAQKIASGEASVPEMPKGAKADPLWRPVHFEGRPPAEEAGRERPRFQPMPQPKRKVNMEKCKYPECTLCVDNCIVNSIDFSATPPVFRKNCINCSLCDKMCPVGAIEVDAETMQRRTQHVINIAKCKYPECTICVDHCPMNAIDFSVNPPVSKWSCEGCDLCWVICPEGAIEITNLETTHARMAARPDQDHPFLKLLAEAEAKGKFRRLTPLDKVGWDNIIYKIKRHPRFSIEELEKD